MRQWKDNIRANLTEIIRVTETEFLLLIHEDDDMVLSNVFV